MSNQLYPTDLTDSQWDLIEDMIPEPKSRGRPRELDMRQVVNAILYLAAAGVQWRMLPREYPCWQSVYSYFRKWERKGVWKRIHDTLRAQVREKEGRHKHPTAGSIDSQSVKAAGWPGERGYDAGKRVNGRKRHIVVDTIGLLFAVAVTPANVQDRDGAKAVLSRLAGSAKKLRLLWADGGYSGKLLAWVDEHFRFHLRIVRRPPEQRGFAVLPRRWVVERTFGWLSFNRRLAKDYETLPSTSETFMYIAMIRVMIRRLEPA